jgi:hypothetical protein
VTNKQNKQTNKTSKKTDIQTDRQADKQNKQTNNPPVLVIMTAVNLAVPNAWRCAQLKKSERGEELEDREQLRNEKLVSMLLFASDLWH